MVKKKTVDSLTCGNAEVNVWSPSQPIGFGPTMRETGQNDFGLQLL